MTITLPRFFKIVGWLTLVVLCIGCDSKSANTVDDQEASVPIPSTQTAPGIDTVLVSKGKLLFSSNCGKCHSVFKTDNLLQGVVRKMGEHYFILYVTRQDSLIKVKDPYALKLKEAYGHLGNSHNFDFSGDDLNAIIAFLKKYSS